jgi:hypothetical protein
MSAQKPEVEAFLNDFKQKMAVFGIVFYRSRTENLRTVLELELNEVSVRKCLSELAAEDYYKGPTKDNDGGPDLWEFGRQMKSREIYIKITMGRFNKPVVCISFHFPVRTINYPFR